MSRILRLTLLAPDIITAILDGQQPESLTLAYLMEPLPMLWSERGCGWGLQVFRSGMRRGVLAERNAANWLGQQCHDGGYPGLDRMNHALKAMKSPMAVTRYHGALENAAT